MSNKYKEYFRLGRLFNAEILALIFILSYMLTARLYDTTINVTVLVGLFIAGILAHVEGAYNNDRMDLSIDKEASYCSHKPLVSGAISLRTAKIIEVCALLIFILIILVLSPKISTVLFLFGAVSLAYLYNRFNKSNMFINIIGQMYAGFAVLIGMSMVVDFDFIVFLSAIVIGLNGIYLNIIEADLKDVKGDVVNVPKALGVRFEGEKVVNTTRFYLLNECIKLVMFILILAILFREQVITAVLIVACLFFLLNYYVRYMMFKNLTGDREKMKRYIAMQELTSILLISTIYMIIHPLLPIVIVLFVMLWLFLWNRFLWGTYIRPQV